MKQVFRKNVNIQLIAYVYTVEDYFTNTWFGQVNNINTCKLTQLRSEKCTIKIIG